MSSVTTPSKPSIWSPMAAVVPMVGLKFFRDGDVPSANVLCAFRKMGQKDTNFFAHACTNHFTENVVSTLSKGS